MKKKIVTLLFASFVSVSVVACGGSETKEENTQKVSTEDTTEVTDAPTEEPTAEPTEELTEEPTEGPVAEPTDEPVASNQTEIEVSDFLTCPEFTAEKNTSAMVDQIALTAKEYAETLTDEQAAEIIDAIRDAGHKFYNGPDEMEKFMWYGYLLDYKYDDSDPRSELGMDLYQAIKYVYRNVETALDDSTQENLRQIDEDLAAIK